MTAEITLPHNDENLNNALLELLSDSTDLRNLAARALESVLNEVMSIEADGICNAELGQKSEERANREIKRRAKVVQVFPSEASLMRLVGSVLAEMDEDWSTRCYMAPETLLEVFERTEQCEEIDTEEKIAARKRATMVIKLMLDQPGKAA